MSAASLPLLQQLHGAQARPDSSSKSRRTSGEQREQRGPGVSFGGVEEQGVASGVLSGGLRSGKFSQSFGSSGEKSLVASLSMPQRSGSEGGADQKSGELQLRESATHLVHLFHQRNDLTRMRF